MYLGRPCITFGLFFGFQDISCIKDLTSLYEAATIEDVYIAYQQLKVDDDSLYSCIGVAGMQANGDINGEYAGASLLEFTVYTVFWSSALEILNEWN